MKAYGLRKHILMTFISLLLCVACMPATVWADEVIDTEQSASLRVYFGEGGSGFADVEFSLYRVADISENGAFTLSGDFQEYPVNLDGLDSSGWRALAQTLDAYAERDALRPMKTGSTGQDGKAAFSALTTGLYLITGESYTSGEKIYTPEAMLVSLPGLTAEDRWNYEMEVSCKFNSLVISEEPVKHKVQKVWKDDGDEEKRPESITVQLLENGTVADTVTLSQKNNWEYTWENLNGSSRWQVAEAETPEGYTVTVVQEGTLFVMTNTRPSEPPPKLPQTGMLWWPVPLLACGGLLLVAIGFFMRRRQGDQDEQ